MNEMMAALINNDADAVKALIARGANPNAKNNLGQAPILAAAWLGHPECVKALIDFGADLNARDGDRNTALMLAVQKSFQAEMLKLQLKRYTDTSWLLKTDKQGGMLVDNERLKQSVDPLVDKFFSSIKPLLNEGETEEESLDTTGGGILNA